ncbi:hypothetical protein PENTCL1PPCAC_28842, partial [Pristionchus entomophagus]
SPGVDLQGCWREMEKMITSAVPVTRVDETILQALFDDAFHEKERIETDQIIARLMFKPCFNHIDDPENRFITLRKKFRYLARYYLQVQDYNRFGLVVMTSIIRAWPVTISYVDEKKPSYTWDRAPLSIAMKGGSIRKDGDKYMIRVLALEDKDIGTILHRAEANTQLLAIDEHGKEVPTSAFIIELNREGGGGERKREAPMVIEQAKRPKAVSRSTKNREEDAQSPKPSAFFESAFSHEPSGEGQPYIFVGRNGKIQQDFVDDESKNLIFTINNISIIDPSTRATITQKYLLKTRFEFQFIAFNTSFIIRSTEHYPTDPSDYQMAVRSMPFEVSSNASTHWKKSFAAIWDTLFLYHYNLGQLSPDELKRGSKDEGNKLCWGKVKEMVKQFISCRSEFHVRPLMETELRTVSRMILARRLAEYNEFIKKRLKRKIEGWWIIDSLSLGDKEKIIQQILGKPMRRPHDEDAHKTFTQLLNSEMQSIEMPDNFAVKQSDFTDYLVVVSGTIPELASCTIHSWLHAVSEIIAGPTLHIGCPETSIRMFNRQLITLRSAESAKRTVRKILELAQTGLRTSDPLTNVLMIRIDEREEYRLLFEMIDPSNVENPYHFGFYNTKAIKETKIAIKDKNRLNERDLNDAIRDGVITKNKIELGGLFAVLKTGYLSNFHKIIKSSEGKLIIFPIFKSKNSTSARNSENVGYSEPAYPYDFTPAEMVNNEINPAIGPLSAKSAGDTALEVYSQADTTISRAMASMRLQDQSHRQMQQSQQHLLQQQQYSAQYQFDVPIYTPESVVQPECPAYQMMPAVQHMQTMQQPLQPLQQLQINHYYGGAPPPYNAQSGMVNYTTQGAQVHPPPPDPVNESLVGINNPNYESL